MRELKSFVGETLYAGPMSVQNEYIPLLFELILYFIENDRVTEAAQFMLDLRLNMSLFHENVMGLLLKRY